MTLIKREFKVDLSLTTVNVYLWAWRMSVQRPIHRGIEKGEKRVRRWKLGHYPGIAKLVKAENAGT